MLTVRISGTGEYQHVDMVPVHESVECEDYVQAELEVTLATSHNTVVGKVRGYAAVRLNNGISRAWVS